MTLNDTAEGKRLADYRARKSNWRQWGPYLSERQWGTVREDYSAGGNAWEFFPHDHARSKAYRWGEDGIAGISDRFQYLCFALAFWNERDPILKERLFGLTSQEGNHGEDVKEYYYYLDSVPTHSYMKMLYKYPHAEFPYAKLTEENRKRGKHDREYELIETGVFEGNRYFDCIVEYAKAAENDIFIRVTVVNRGPEKATLHLLPTLWYRNTWSWGYPTGPMNDVSGIPRLNAEEGSTDYFFVRANHPVLGDYFFYAVRRGELLFTNNETNANRLYGFAQSSWEYSKDAFHSYLIGKNLDAVNPASSGTKAAVHYTVELGPGAQESFELRLVNSEQTKPFEQSKTIFATRLREADEFYQAVQDSRLGDDERSIQRQAFGGLLWSKQLYYYDVEQWVHGDPSGPPPPRDRGMGRNRDWQHLTNFDVISMPDKWEYPWYAAWDLAFHAIAFSLIDTDFAKRQLELMTREWYMHPNGQLPAYEWAFGDVNPPVHAWAAWRVYKIDAKIHGKPDREFLEGVFHKLLLNFTWWVNRKDAEGRNIFQGGFLGLDNIGVFDRSAPLPTGGHIDQADGTSWMAAYSLTMLRIALELSTENRVYQDAASKFLEHFLRIAHAMNNIGGDGLSLWNEEDGFFYDLLHLPDGKIVPLKIRSLVGLLPLFAVETIEPEVLEMFPDFERRLKWFVKNRPHLSGNMARVDTPGVGKRRLLAILTKNKLVRVLKRLLDPDEFLSPYGIRSLSRYHEKNPYSITANGNVYTVDYQPAESTTLFFGGNSNWRGPIWFPMNFLIIEALQKFHHYYGDALRVECPTGSGKMCTLAEVATEISQRLIRLFTLDPNNKRPCHGASTLIQNDPHWRDLIPFYEYFHPETGEGLGASHQTGWTALVAKLIQQSGDWTVLTGHWKVDLSSLKKAEKA